MQGYLLISTFDSPTNQGFPLYNYNTESFPFRNDLSFSDLTLRVAFRFGHDAVFTVGYDDAIYSLVDGRFMRGYRNGTDFPG